MVKGESRMNQFITKLKIEFEEMGVWYFVGFATLVLAMLAAYAIRGGFN